MNTESAVHRCKEVREKKMDAVHAAAEHKIEPIARATASCSTARQIMFDEIKKRPTTLNSVQTSMERVLRLFAGKVFRLLLCIQCNDYPSCNLRNRRHTNTFYVNLYFWYPGAKKK